MSGVVEVGMRGGSSKCRVGFPAGRRWLRRVVYVVSSMPGKSWDGGVDTVHGHDAVKDKRAGVGGRTRRIRW